MKSCLITGATGLIGSHLINELKKEWEVYAVSRKNLSDQYGDENVHSVELNFGESWHTDVLPTELDAIIHLAQPENYRGFPDQAEEVFSVNTISTLRLLSYAKQCGAKTFVLASSGGIYGYSEDAFTENEPIITRDNLDFFLATKLCSEILAENYSSYMNVIMLRFFFVYGPGQRENMLIPRLVKSVLEGKPVTLQGENGLKINPIFVGDAVNAIMNTLTLDDSYKINIGGSESISLRNLCNIIGQVTGKEPVFETSGTSEPKHLLGDIQKMTKLLVAPETKFEDGIKRYIDSL